MAINRKGTTGNKQYTKKIKCTGKCNRELVETKFYMSNSPMFPSGRVNICKDCIKSMVNYNDIETIYTVLRTIDIPFVRDVWESCENKKQEKLREGSTYDVLGNYIRQISSLPQWKASGWRNSSFEKNIKKPEEKEFKNTILKKQKIELTQDKLNELEEKYGYGFDEEEYINFEKKYKKLTLGYKEKTTLHTERLITYIIHKVKEEMATAKGDVNEAEKWSRIAQKDAETAKLNISQLSKSDITGGIDLLPQLVEAVEERATLIPLLPKVKEQPYDDADMVIWCTINYLRRLEDKDTIEYKDIWGFYDQMIYEFYYQKGYSEEQIEGEKEKRNNVFRDLSKVYIEPLYEGNDEMFGENEEEEGIEL